MASHLVAGIRSGRIRDLARSAIAQGWSIEQQGNGHPVLVSPDGARVWLSSTKRDSYHVVDNVRASLRRAGWRDPARSQRSAPELVARAPAPIAPPRSQYPAGIGTGYATRRDPELTVARATGDEPRSLGDPTMATQVDSSAHTDRGVQFIAKGKAVRAEDIRLSGQPFRLRYNVDGSIDITTLRRKQQRNWGRKDGDAEAIKATAAKWLTTVPPWEEPPARKGANGANGASVKIADHDEAAKIAAEMTAAAVARAEPEPVVEPVVEPKPKHTPADHALASHVIAEHLPAVPSDRSHWSAVRVDDGDYPIATALDELDRAIMPALAALEAAGKGEAAALVRGELTRTPAEDELLSLWRELHNRPRLEHGAG